jgi:hypothetical protein
LFFFKNFWLDLKHSARRAYALHDVDKGALILEEGACAAFLGIDAVWINAYGWPAYRGGRCSGGKTSATTQSLPVFRSTDLPRQAVCWRPVARHPDYRQAHRA